MDENVEINIPRERRIEIDDILRKTEEDIGRQKVMTYEEFKERLRKNELS